MTRLVATSIFGDISDDSSKSQDSIPWYPFIDMHGEEYDKKRTLAQATIAQDTANGFLLHMKRFGQYKSLLLKLEEMVCHNTEKETTMEVKSTEFNDIIAHVSNMYTRGLLQSNLFTSKS